MLRYLRGKGLLDLLHDLIQWAVPSSIGKVIAIAITLALWVGSVVLMIMVNYSTFRRWF